MIETERLRKVYPDGLGMVCALDIPAFRAARGSQWAIVGPSGSGKSTLLHCLAGLTRPTEGRIYIDGNAHDSRSEKELAQWRSEQLGYVLQESNLLPSLTVADNIRVSAHFARREVTPKFMEDMLESVGLFHGLHKLPEKLSRGEQQRVAIARALVKEPAYLFADEPTANLDGATSRAVMELLCGYSRKHGATLLVATHDPIVMEYLPQRLELSKGDVHVK